ncbi:MAG: hypothetical protein WCE83_14245, partial [Candidatus Baltobacteraceae bacterium]
MASAFDGSGIVRAALEAGASAVAIAAAASDDSVRARMNEAFARGDFATWPYDAGYAARAGDPRA